MPEFTKSQIEQISRRLADDDHADILFLQGQRKALTQAKYEESLDPDNLYDRRRAAAFNHRLLDSAFENPQKLALLPPPIDLTRLRQEQAGAELQLPQQKEAIEDRNESFRPSWTTDLSVDVIAKNKLYALAHQVQDIAERTGTAKEDLIIRIFESHHTELKKSWTKELLDGHMSARVIESYYSNRIDRVNEFAYELRNAFPHLASEIGTLDPKETRREIEKQVRQYQELRQGSAAHARTAGSFNNPGNPAAKQRAKQDRGYGY